MDFAYDHIAERTYSTDRSTTPKPSDNSTSDSETTSTTPTHQSQPSERQNLQTEFKETFKAFSESPWGTKLGGWWSTARTQGASYYETARKEAEKREAEAAKVLEDARRTVVEKTKTVVEAAENGLDNIVNEDKKAEQQATQQEAQQRPLEAESARDGSSMLEGEDTETFINRFKVEAGKRLKEVQKAEDAADEALLRFGSNIRSFLKDTISITAPEPSHEARASEVLFESKDATTGKRVIHTSRFDAQLHVIHTTPSSFTSDPEGSEEEWESFGNRFDIEQKTDRIAKDLDKYTELRNSMEALVPEKVDYKDFWTRYYFLRHVVESQEEKRKELLKASTIDQEQVAWDEDSDSDEVEKKNKQPDTKITTTIEEAEEAPSRTEPLESINTHTRMDSDAMTLKAPRRSHDEKSVADSEASYDLVSGAASHANSSPKVKHVKEEESDDDWE